jgi:hypothetical protein
MRVTNPPAGDEKTIPVTIFPNRFAKDKSERQMSLDELCAFVLSKKKRSKHRLPLIKLASFSDKRTEADCLRFDDNVNVAYGIEVDYDREVIAFDGFVAKLCKAKIRAASDLLPSSHSSHPTTHIALCKARAAVAPSASALEPA